MDHEVLIGYDPELDLEFMLTIWDDGRRQVATRPGQGRTEVQWSAPVVLEGVAA